MVPQGNRLWPIIGTDVLDDDGDTWDDLGIILTVQAVSHAIPNTQLLTAVSGVLVILDNNSDPADHYLYIVFSSYGGELEEQGVSFARILWIDRDRPLDRASGQSKATKWYRSGWTQPGIDGYSTGMFDDPQKVSWQR
jgi:hypothetical protein